MLKRTMPEVDESLADTFLAPSIFSLEKEIEAIL